MTKPAKRRRYLDQPLAYVRKRKLYKYRTTKDWECYTGIHGAPTDVLPWVVLRTDGVLWIRRGYAWDGPSGPTVDTRNWMRPSLVHDALYQLMREGQGVLDYTYRYQVDRLMYRMLLEEGMSRFRAWYSYQAVRAFGGPRAKKRREREIVVP